MFFRIGVLQNFAMFTGKHLCRSLFLMKLQTQTCNFIKKRLQRRYFPLKFVKFLSTSFLQNGGVVPRFVSGVLQPYLVINVTGLAHFGKKLNYIFPPVVSQNYLLQSISVKLMYQFLYLINIYLFFRCLEKVFEDERRENKKEIIEVLQQTSYRRTTIGN